MTMTIKLMVPKKNPEGGMDMSGGWAREGEDNGLG